MSDLERAKALLDRPGCTFAAVCGNQERTSVIRGVRPLLYQLEEGLDGWSCADKAVGKAPAMLYVLLGVKEVVVDAKLEVLVNLVACAKSNREACFVLCTILHVEPDIPVLRNGFLNAQFCPHADFVVAILC